jgi:hypothetical protein
VQVDPIKPTLRPPGTKRLKLKYDKPLSSFAYNFNSRRYTKQYLWDTRDHLHRMLKTVNVARGSF